MRKAAPESRPLFILLGHLAFRVDSEMRISAARTPTTTRGPPRPTSQQPPRYSPRHRAASTTTAATGTPSSAGRDLIMRTVPRGPLYPLRGGAPSRLKLGSFEAHPENRSRLQSRTSHWARFLPRGATENSPRPHRISRPFSRCSSGSLSRTADAVAFHCQPTFTAPGAFLKLVADVANAMLATSLM